MENPKKDTRWYQRGIAILLLACCVLSVVPSNFFAFANWIIRDATPGEEVKPTKGEYTVNLKYFADNMYFPESNDSVVTYFAYDPATNKETGTEYREFDLSKFTPVALSRENSTTSVVLDHTNTSTVYCDKRSHANVCTHKDTKNGMLKFSAANIELNIGDYSVNLLDDSITSSLSVNIVDKSDETIELVSSKEYRLGVVSSTTDEDGVTTLLELYIVVSDASLLVGIDNFSTSGKQCSNGLFGLGASDATKTYTATSSSFRGFGGTYKCYVKKTVGQAAYTESNLTQIKVDKDGVLHKMEHLSAGYELVMPSYEELKSYLPTNYVSYAYIKDQYPIGFYLGAQMETDNNKGTKIESFPYIVKASDADSDKVITIWVEWGVLPPGTSQGDINGEVATKNEAGSGTVNVYNIAVPGTGYSTIQKDKAQLTSSADSWSLYTDVASGVTLNFCMNDGRTNVNIVDADGNAMTPTLDDNCADSTSDSSVVFKEGWSSTVDLSDNVRDYTVSLQNDISVSGSLQVGGYTGVVSNGNSYPHGYIVKNYVALDLNGHVLTVESGGTLDSFGYIYDSVGTGKIIVKPGGTIYVPLVIYGWHGTANSLETYALGYSPFEDYNLPYVETTIEVETNNSNSGSLIGRAMLYTTAATKIGYGSITLIDADAAIINIELHFFGQSDSSLFSTSLKGTASSGKVTMTTVVHEQIQEDAANVKNIFTLENITSTFSTPVLEVGLMGMSFRLPLERVRFPISPMVDVNFKNSDITLNQQIMLMPGSTMTFDEKSVLNLGYSYVDESGNHTEKPIDGVSALSYSYVDDADLYLVGGIFAPSYNFQNMQVSFGGQKTGLAFGNLYKKFWNVFDRATVNVYGTVNFKSGNKSAYILSGNVNVSSFSVNGGDSIDWELSNLTKANLTDKNVALSTYGAIAVPGYHDTDVLGGHTLSILGKEFGGPHTTKFAHYYCLPMISNGKAYVVDADVGAYTGAMEGSYDVNTGIFTRTAFLSDGTSNSDFAADAYSQCIILPNPDTSALGSETNTVITFSASIAGVTMVSNELVSDGNKQYVYYAGTYNPLSDTVAANATSCSMLQTNFITDGASKTYALKWSNGKWVAA